MLNFLTLKEGVQVCARLSISLILCSLILAAFSFFVSGDTEVASAQVVRTCGGGPPNGRCFHGYSFVVGNHGVGAQLTAPTNVRLGNGFQTSFILLNAQGSFNPGDVYSFIQAGLVTSSAGFCGAVPGAFWEFNNRLNGAFPNGCNMAYEPVLGSKHGYAVQYDGTHPGAETWDWTYDGAIYHREFAVNVGFSGSASISVYGETTDPSTQMGGVNAANPVTASEIAYKAGVTGGFTKPFVAVFNDYAGNDDSHCNITPEPVPPSCPYGRSQGNDNSHPFWFIRLWTN